MVDKHLLMMTRYCYAVLNLVVFRQHTRARGPMTFKTALSEATYIKSVLEANANHLLLSKGISVVQCVLHGT
jgi:hypothetical protein